MGVKMCGCGPGWHSQLGLPARAGNSIFDLTGLAGQSQEFDF